MTWFLIKVQKEINAITANIKRNQISANVVLFSDEAKRVMLFES